MPTVEKIDNIIGPGAALRVTRRKAVQRSKNVRTTPTIRVKCGDCDETLIISTDEHPTRNIHFDCLEINGVLGTIYQWRELLLPLLQID